MGLVQLPRIESRVFWGLGEIRAFATELFLETFNDVRIELLDDPREVADGILIAENLAYFRGRDGIETQARRTMLIKIRNGKQTSLTLYQTKQEALEAVGLSE